MLQAYFLLPKLEMGTGSHGNLPPLNLWSAPERTQPPHHSRGGDQELRPDLEENILLSPSTTFTTLTDAFYQHEIAPSVILQSLSTVTWVSWTEVPHPQSVQTFVIFVGIHWLTTTGLVQESSTSPFVPAQAAQGDRAGGQSHSLIWPHPQITQPAAWPCPASGPADPVTDLVAAQELGRQGEFGGRCST